jgi:hypothetical protein
MTCLTWCKLLKNIDIKSLSLPLFYQGVVFETSELNILYFNIKLVFLSV